jgi:regulator of replication initiation timing
MKKYKYLSITGLFFILIISACIGQSLLDSAIINRNNILNELRSLDENPITRSWNKLSEIYQKAKEVIDADNVLINEYLSQQIENNIALKNDIEKLKMELTLVKKETELQAWHLEDNKSEFKILLSLVGGLCILFIIILVLFIDRQIKYRSIKIELERTWPVKEELEKGNNFQHEISRLIKQVGELTMKNSSLTDEVNTLNLEKTESQNRLEKEIQSKKQIEEEIKNLIDQLKVT